MGNTDHGVNPQGDSPTAAEDAQAAREMLGCDSAILEQATEIKEAMTQRDMQVARSMITQSPPVEIITCLDQDLQRISAAGALHANPGGDISRTTGPLVEQPMIQNIMSNFSNLNTPGSLMSAINTSYQEVVQSFNDALGSMTGGLLGGGGLGDDAGAGGCDMMQQSWLMSQCLDMPTFPSLKACSQGLLMV